MAVVATDTWTILANISLPNPAETARNLKKILGALDELRTTVDENKDNMKTDGFFHNSLVTAQTKEKNILFINYLQGKINGMHGRR